MSKKDWGRWQNYRAARFERLGDDELLPCKTCGRPTDKTSTKLCDPCWEVEHRLGYYLADGGKVAADVLRKALAKAGT